MTLRRIHVHNRPNRILTLYCLSMGRSVACMRVFDEEIVRCLCGFRPRRPDVERAAVDGPKLVNKTKRIVIYDGGPKGAMCMSTQRGRQGGIGGLELGEKGHHTHT